MRDAQPRRHARQMCSATLKRTATAPRRRRDGRADVGAGGSSTLNAALDAIRRVDRLAPVAKPCVRRRSRAAQRKFVVRLERDTMTRRRPELIPSGIARYEVYVRDERLSAAADRAGRPVAASPSAGATGSATCSSLSPWTARATGNAAVST